MTRLQSAGAILLLAHIAGSGVASASPPAADLRDLREPELRCGAYCVYLALHAIDKPVPNFAALEDVLGEPGPNGYSMQQLAEAMRHFGVFSIITGRAW